MTAFHQTGPPLIKHCVRLGGWGNHKTKEAPHITDSSLKSQLVTCVSTTCIVDFLASAGKAENQPPDVCDRNP